MSKVFEPSLHIYYKNTSKDLIKFSCVILLKVKMFLGFLVKINYKRFSIVNSYRFLFVVLHFIRIENIYEMHIRKINVLYL